MPWLALLELGIKLLSQFTGWLSNKQLLDAGKAEDIAANLTGALEELRRAQTVGNQLKLNLEQHPERVHDDDGFKRK